MPYVVIRHYKDGSKLIDELEQRREDVENLIRGISGFIAYNLVRTESGGFSVSVYEDRAGAEESVRAARDYLQQNLPAVSGPPEVIQGDAVISFSG
jgi:heme-degrading monooxygenase HmoA